MTIHEEFRSKGFDLFVCGRSMYSNLAMPETQTFTASVYYHAKEVVKQFNGNDTKFFQTTDNMGRCTLITEKDFKKDFAPSDMTL